MVLSDKDTMPRDLPDQIPYDYSPTRDDEDEDLSSAFSLASTANDLVEEHGRRYANYRYGSTPFPAGDALSQENEIVFHNMLLYLLKDALFDAPIESPRNALELRSGQLGLWAKTLADVYPEAQVTGMDISFGDSEGRPNCEFKLMSWNDEWILDDVCQIHGKFDLIYARLLYAGSSDYEQLYTQCFENLEPGGYLEEVEIEIIARNDDGQVRSDSVVARLANEMPNRLGNAFGTDYHLASRMRTLIERAGFVNVQEKRIKLPTSPWPTPGTDYHQLGAFLQKFYETGLQGWMIAPMTRFLGYKLEEVNELCNQAFEELRRNDQHWYFTMVYVTARKPLDAPE